jgi:hypothetical protein
MCASPFSEAEYDFVEQSGLHHTAGLRPSRDRRLAVVRPNFSIGTVSDDLAYFSKLTMQTDPDTVTLYILPVGHNRQHSRKPVQTRASGPRTPDKIRFP